MSHVLIGALPPWLAALVWLVIAGVGAVLAALWRRIRTEDKADEQQLAELLTKFHERVNDVDERLGDVETELYRDNSGDDDEW